MLTTATLEPEPIPLDVKVVLVGERQLYYLLAQADPDFARALQGRRRLRRARRAATAPTIGRYARLLGRLGATREACARSTASGVARVLEHALRGRRATREALDRCRGSGRPSARGRLLGGARPDDRDRRCRGRQAPSTRARSALDRVRELHPGADRRRARSRIDTAGRGGRPDQRPLGPPAWAASPSAARAASRPAIRMGGGRGDRHRARGQARRPPPLQGRADPRGFLAATLRPDAPLVAVGASWSSSSPMAASTATAPPRPSSTRCSRRSPRCRSGSASPSPARSTRRARCRRSAASTRRSRASSTSAQARGLDGRQGVLIPAANVAPPDAPRPGEAGRRGGAVQRLRGATIDEGIELLTGLPAGERGADGTFPEGTVFRQVEDRLRRSPWSGARSCGSNAKDGPAEGEDRS